MKRVLIAFLCLVTITGRLVGQNLKTIEDTIRVSEPITIVLSEKYPAEKFRYDGYINDRSEETWRDAASHDVALKKLSEKQEDEAKKYLSLTKEINDTSRNHDYIVIDIQGKLEKQLTFCFDIVEKDSNNENWNVVLQRKIILIPDDKGALDSLQESSQLSKKTQAGSSTDNEQSVGNSSEQESTSGHFTIANWILENHITVIYVILSVLIVIIVVLIFLLYVLARETKQRSDSIQTIEHDLKKIQQSQQRQVELPTKEDLLKLVSEEDLMPMISELIRSNDILQLIKRLTDNALSSKVAIPSGGEVSPSNENDNIFVHKEEPNYFDNVVYDSETNTFKIVASVSVTIFRIIVKEGDYFYTLVDDADIRKEFVSVLGNYKKCINVIQESSFPSLADVNEGEYGHLFRDGNVFRVDPAKPLTIILR